MVYDRRRNYKSKYNNRNEKAIIVKEKKKSPTTKQLKKEIKEIKDDLIELKHFDTAFTTQNATSGNGLVVNLMNIDQGDQPTNRNGNQIKTTSAQIRFHVITPVGQRGTCFLRCIVFWDRQANLSAPVMKTSTNNQGMLDDRLSQPTLLTHINFNAIDRYKILYDKVYTINPVTMAAWSFSAPNGSETEMLNEGIHKELYIKASRVVKYGDDGSASVWPLTNSLCVAFYSTVSGADEAPNVSFNGRIYYRDA